MTIEAIVKSFQTNYGITEEIAEKYLARHQRMIAEFSVPESEADRAILAELEKESGLVSPEGKRTPSGSFPVTQIKDIIPNMISVDICAKVISLKHNSTGKVAVSGIIADSSGHVKIAILNGSTCPPDLQIGETYGFYGCLVSEHLGSVSLLVNRNSLVEERNETFDIPTLPVTNIRDLQPGVCSIIGKILRMKTDHEKARYLGTIADATGSIFMACWDRDGPEIPCLHEGKTVRIDHAICSRKSDGSTSLDISSASVKETTGLDNIKDGVDIVGECTSIRAEIVFRCKQCRKILKTEGLVLACQEHGEQREFNREPRLRLRMDTGDDCLFCYLGPNAIRSLTGYSADDLFSIVGRSPLQSGVLEQMLHKVLFGRKLVLTGNRISDNWFINSGSFVNQPVTKFHQSEIVSEGSE